MIHIRPIPEDIGEYLAYDPITGALTWKVSITSRAPAGSVAGYPGTRGYILVGFRRKLYCAHRIAYFLHTGTQVPDECTIDHLNHVTGDNRWRNLRLATYAQNNAYRGAPKRKYPRGVYPSGERFRARMKKHGKITEIGSFDTAEEASVAYVSHFNAHHGSEWNIRSLVSA